MSNKSIILILLMSMTNMYSEYLCDYPTESDECDFICNNGNDEYLLWNIQYIGKSFNKISNETQFYYQISDNECLFEISKSKQIWIELWPSYCCIESTNIDILYQTVTIKLIEKQSNILVDKVILNEEYIDNRTDDEYGWKFAFSISNISNITNLTLIINMNGNIDERYINSSYWIYNINNMNSTNCVQDSIIPSNLCDYHDNLSSFNTTTTITTTTCSDENIIDLIWNDTVSLIICIVIIAVIFLLFMILLIIIICQRRKINQYKEQISEYYEDFRGNKNTEMKTVHYPSISKLKENNSAGGMSAISAMSGLTRSSIGNYSSQNSKSPINFEIVGQKSQNKKTNHYKDVIKKNKIDEHREDDEESISYSLDKEQVGFLNTAKQQRRQITKIKSYSTDRQQSSNNELAKIQNRNIKHNRNSYHVKIPVFSPGDDQHQYLVDKPNVSSDDYHEPYL